MQELWYRALQSPKGIEVECSDNTKVINKLYQIRAKLEDEDLKRISLVQSPFDPNRIWMVKR